jgi:hypothetical protein
MTDRKKGVKSVYSNKETIHDQSILFSETGEISRQRDRKSILKSIMSDYEKKYSNSRRTSGKAASRKSVNFKDAESISYDHSVCPGGTISSIKGSSNIIHINLNKTKKQKDKSDSYAGLVVQITHNTQNNISIIHNDNNPQELDKSGIEFPQFSILRTQNDTTISATPQLQLKKKVGFENKHIEEKTESLKRNKTFAEVSDPNYIGDRQITEGPMDVTAESPRRYFKTSAFKKVHLTGIIEEKEKSISTDEHRRQCLKDIINDPRFPKTVCEKVGCLSGISATSFKNNRYVIELLFRKINEDRANILVNMDVGSKKASVNFLAIYDGHNGERTVEELKNNFHKYIIADGAIMKNTVENILYGYEKMENKVLDINAIGEDKSGACAITAIIIGI